MNLVNHKLVVPLRLPVLKELVATCENVNKYSTVDNFYIYVPVEFLKDTFEIKPDYQQYLKLYPIENIIKIVTVEDPEEFKGQTRAEIKEYWMYQYYNNSPYVVTDVGFSSSNIYLTLTISKNKAILYEEYLEL